MSLISILFFDPRKPFQDMKTGQLMRDAFERLNALISRTGGERGEASGPLPEWTISTLPSASANPRSQIYVSDETGGATIAFSDGTNWRRVQDRAVVS